MRWSQMIAELYSRFQWLIIIWFLLAFIWQNTLSSTSLPRLLLPFLRLPPQLQSLFGAWIDDVVAVGTATRLVLISCCVTFFHVFLLNFCSIAHQSHVQNPPSSYQNLQISINYPSIMSTIPCEESKSEKKKRRKKHRNGEGFPYPAVKSFLLLHSSFCCILHSSLFFSPSSIPLYFFPHS